MEAFLGSVRKKSVAIASQRGIGEQVTQRSTHQSRRRIIILVTCGQVVNVYQYDHVQDEDRHRKTIFSLGHTVPNGCQRVLSSSLGASVLPLLLRHLVPPVL